MKALALPKGGLSGKIGRRLWIAGAVLLGILAAAFLASLLFRVDAEKAREIALAAVGGGEVVGQSMEREGLWNEYSFQISNGGTWYEVEIDSFGSVTDLESGRAHRWD